MDNYYLQSFVKDTKSTTPLFYQIYQYIRSGIIDGTLEVGQLIPPSRVLAKYFNVSRNSVLSGLDILHSEGLIITNQGAGTYISESFENLKSKNTPMPRYSRVQFNPRNRSHSGIFALGISDVKSFPQKQWVKSIKDGIHSSLNYSNKTGAVPFKQAVVEYVKKYRGIVCSTNNIVPICSAQAGFDIILRTLLQATDTVLLEDPFYPAIKSAVQKNNLNIQYHSVGSKNYNNSPKANLAHITPSHQFPTGTTMSANKKISVLNWALKNQAWILENDIDNEFYYDNILPPPLYTMHDNNVLYLGSFSKTLSASVKIGFIIAPEQIAQKLNTSCAVSGQEPSVFIQSAITQMLNEKHLYLHIKKMRKIYQQRKTHIQDYVNKNMYFARIPNNIHTGLQLPILLPDEIPDKQIILELREIGFSCKALSEYSHNYSINGLHLGFGNTDIDSIDKHMEKITKICMMYL